MTLTTVTSPLGSKVLSKNEAVKLLLEKAANPKLVYKLKEVK